MKINKNTPAYYINLDVNIERNINIKRLLTKLEFTNVTKITAINTQTAKLVDNYKSLIDKESYQILINNNKNKTRKFHEELTNGAIGCFLSHQSIYKKIVENNIPNAIIFEDDVTSTLSSNDFWAQLSNIVIPNDADLFIFSGNISEPHHVTKTTYKFKRFTGAYFYLVTNNCAKILSNLNPIKYQIDHQISTLIMANTINAYAYMGPSLVVPDLHFSTTIQNLDCSNCKTKDLSLSLPLIRDENKWYQSKYTILVVILMALIIVVFIYIWRSYIYHKNSK